MYHQAATALQTARSRWRRWRDPRVGRTVLSWVTAELAPWVGPMRQAGPQETERGILALNQREPWVQAYAVTPGKAVAVPKPDALLARLSADDAAAMAKRARLYADFLASAAGPGRCHVAVNLNDVPFVDPAVPVFSFQKDIGSRAILLPDIDLLNDKFVRPSWLSLDPFPFWLKWNSAIFVGSTTGGRIIDQAVLRDLSLPRLRAGVAFRGNPQVRFLLPNIIQCADAATAAAVRQVVDGDGPVSWREQFRHRLILSIDGNGATCSRVVVALKSNSVLVKYRSDRVLYYFQGLQPGTHYLPVETEADVEQAVRDCAADPARFAAIARAGRRFYADYLGQHMVRSYMAALLDAYGAALSSSARVE